MTPIGLVDVNSKSVVTSTLKIAPKYRAQYTCATKSSIAKHWSCIIYHQKSILGSVITDAHRYDYLSNGMPKQEAKKSI